MSYYYIYIYYLYYILYMLNPCFSARPSIVDPLGSVGKFPEEPAAEHEQPLRETQADYFGSLPTWIGCGSCG